MARITHVVVVARIAGGCEGVVPSDRILHDLHQRLEIAVESLGRQARRRIAAAQQRARDGRVKRQVQPLVDLAGGKGLEIRTLPAGDVDDLDEFSGPDEIG